MKNYEKITKQGKHQETKNYLRVFALETKGFPRETIVFLWKPKETKGFPRETNGFPMKTQGKLMVSYEKVSEARKKLVKQGKQYKGCFTNFLIRKH